MSQAAQINQSIRYFDANGRPTIEGLKLFGGMERRIQAAEGKLAAIATIAAPTGGAVTDAQARAAINAIIGAAE